MTIGSHLKVDHTEFISYRIRIHLRWQERIYSVFSEYRVQKFGGLKFEKTIFNSDLVLFAEEVGSVWGFNRRTEKQTFMVD